MTEDEMEVMELVDSNVLQMKNKIRTLEKENKKLKEQLKVANRIVSDFLVFRC